MKEEYLLSDKPEPTNEGFALAKIVGLKLCEYYNSQHGTNFIGLIPCNLYGPNDHFEPEKSHVMSASILKFHDAKEKNLPFVEVWGTGNVKREFLFVDDLADAMIYFMLNHDSNTVGPYINIGSGKDVSIKELSLIIKKLIGYKGELKFDVTKKPQVMITSSMAALILITVAFGGMYILGQRYLARVYLAQGISQYQQDQLDLECGILDIRASPGHEQSGAGDCRDAKRAPGPGDELANQVAGRVAESRQAEQTEVDPQDGADNQRDGEDVNRFQEREPVREADVLREGEALNPIPEGGEGHRGGPHS